MKKQFFIAFIFLLFQTQNFAQEKSISASSNDPSTTKLNISEANKALDDILDITEKISIYRKNVKWKTILPQVRSTLDINAPNVFLAVKPSVELLLDKLNDNHSFLLYNNKERAHRANPKNFESTINPITLETLKQDDKKVKTEKLTDNIGYILIPSNNIDLSDREKQEIILGQEIRDSLCNLLPEKLKGIVVDLRINTGGNMFPMVGGLGPIIGDGDAGFIISNGKTINSWSINNGSIKGLTLENNCEQNHNIKIVILIGPATGSSGEITAISFIGKPNIKLIGENSAGYTTANTTIKIAENLHFFLAIAYDADRNKKEYRNFITPDITIKDGDNFKDLSQDKKIQKAIEWINQ